MIRVKKVYKLVMYLIIFVLGALLRIFIRTKKNLLVFGCRGGLGFEGNAKYLYLYVSKKGKQEAIFITKRRDLIDKLRNKGLKAEYYYSIKAIINTLRADVVFITHSLTDVPFIFFNSSTRLVNLWHGIPVKKVSFCDKNLSLKARLMDYLRDLRTNIFVSNSEFYNKFYLNCFKLEEKKLLSVGLPRIGYLYNNMKIRKDKEKTVILYAPTFRDYVDFNPFFERDFLRLIDSKLTKNKAILWIKLHPFLSFNLEEKKFLNIKVLPIQEDIYEFLPNVDVLISDYSSIILDYVIANEGNVSNKLLLFCYDLEYYKKERGFLIDFEELFRPFIVRDKDTLLDRLDCVLSDTKGGACISKEQLDLLYNMSGLGKECEQIISYISGK